MNNNNNTQGSRFGRLSDEKKPEQHRYETPRYERRGENSFNRPSYGERIMRGRAFYDQQQRDEKERKVRELEKSMKDLNSFPELSSKRVVENANGLNFIDKVNNMIVEEPEKSDGWDILGDQKKNAEQIIGLGIRRRRDASPSEIFAALNNNYERWKAEYIEEYGEDYYERYYRFPNYDYEYFDKLDEKYEYEMFLQEENEREREESEYTDYDQYMDYVNDKHN
jgi:hypothetical protein